MHRWTSMFITHFSVRVRRIFYYHFFYKVSFISRTLLKLVWNLYYFTKQMSDDENQTMKFQREKRSSVGVTSIDTSTWTEPRKRLSKDEKWWIFELERERGWIICQPLSLCTEQLSYVSPLDTSTPLTEPIRETHETRWVYKIQESVSLVKPLIYPMSAPEEQIKC